MKKGVIFVRFIFKKWWENKVCTKWYEENWIKNRI